LHIFAFLGISKTSHSHSLHISLASLFVPVFPSLITPTLNLHLSQPLLPDNNIRRNTILPVVQQHRHAIRVHALTREELVILEASNNLLSVGTSALLESVNLGLRGVLLLQGRLDLLHVLLEMCEVGLLVERGLVQAEGVDDVDDLLGRVLDTLLGFFGRGIAAGVYWELEISECQW